MNFLKEIEILKFRSINEAQLKDVSDFTILAGLNNSGKSNLLKAIHLFFTDNVEPGIPLVFSRDFSRRDLNTKKKKRISIEIAFSLPSTFKFRKGLEQTEALLGTNFRIRKEWGPDGSDAEFFLNGSTAPETLEDSRKIENFLRLVSVRYIPNRVIPTELISKEHQALRDVLVRRLTRQKNQSTALFNSIKQTSSELLQDLSTQMRNASPDLDSVALSTAESLADLAFKFGYQILEGGTYTSEDEQGSGIQSLLMFRTLSLIDQDYFKQFGWKQAALWLVEEPESSLHTSLEAQVAYFLRELSTRKDGRLQTLATTHSDLLIQYSTSSYLISKTNRTGGGLESKAEQLDQRTLLDAAAKFGISRWVDPILYHPLDTIVLVEGRFDKAFIEECQLALKIQAPFKVFALEDLLQNQAKGGIDTLIQFIKDRAQAIKSRSKHSPVVLLADWDASNKSTSLASTFKHEDPFQFIAWDTKDANPLLNESFRGIERFMSTRIIDEANNQCGNIIGKKGNGVYMVQPSDFGKLKSKANEVIRKGLTETDAIHAKALLKKISEIAKQAK